MVTVLEEDLETHLQRAFDLYRQGTDLLNEKPDDPLTVTMEQKLNNRDGTRDVRAAQDLAHVVFEQDPTIF